MKNSCQTTCPYCGVGCGILADFENNKLSVSGDKTHPSNFGRLCSKGAALGETIDLHGRLLYPEIAGERCDWDSALKKAADGFSAIIKKHGADAVAFYVSGQLLTEDYYVANKLMKGFIGSANIDTNSRLCMSSSVAGHKRAFGADVVPGCYEDFELADLIILTGSNTAWCHPVIYQRISAAKEKNPRLKVVVIDPRKTATCDIADLHLAIAPGTDALLWNGLLVYLQRYGATNINFVEQCCEGLADALSAAEKSAPDIPAVARDCGLAVADVDRFFQYFIGTEKVVSAYSQGINQSSSGTDKVNAIINCHLLTGRIGRSGMGPFSLTGQPNAMGGREVGGMANMLAAHMDIENKQHQAIVQEFWQAPCIPKKPGLKAVELFEKIGDGTIKAVWIMATNPVVSMPDANKIKAALKKCELVIVSDCIKKTDTTKYADILFPALTWGEKDGTVTNSERRISRQRPFLPRPGEAKADWQIICEFAQYLGYKEAFNFSSAAQIFRQHAALSAYKNGSGKEGSSECIRAFNIAGLKDIDDEAYDQLAPIQWPVTAQSIKGTSRLFTQQIFFTANKKAQFIPIVPRPPFYATGKDFPLVLNTGRIRDQWHTMTRTGKSPRLSAHINEPYVEVHPHDVMHYKLSDGGLAQIISRWGEITVRVVASEDQRLGSIFVPMHWNEQFALNACVDVVVNPVTDPVSGEPEFKHTPVSIKSFEPAWYGFALSRRELDISNPCYLVRATGKRFYRYEFAGNELQQDWGRWARSFLCAEQEDVEWIDYLDSAVGQYRGARLLGNHLESCIFIAPTIDLPPRTWLADLFVKEELSTQERSSLLAGRPGQGQADAGRIICACFGVGEKTIAQAIAQQSLATVEQVGACLNAGTNCGSCIPELKQLLTRVKSH